MTRVFVNGISAKSAGGLSILTNFLAAAHANQDSFKYVVATPSLDDYDAFQSDRIQIVPLGWRSHTPFVPLMSISYLPKIAKKFGCDVIFNLSDIPLKTRIPQVFLFDWPYAIYPDSIAWTLMSRREFAQRSLKLFLFKKLLAHVNVTIAQSELVRKALERQYDIKNISVIPNTHHLEDFSNESIFDFCLGDGYKCLFISRYYSHKNFEILVPLAELIKDRGNSLKIIITLGPTESPGAAAFLKSIKDRKLEGVIKNVGSVPLNKVFDLFQQADALLMPTLLETMGLTYLEAMYCSKVIFTSDLPFAHTVCGDAAIYFDPFDPGDILTQIEQAMKRPDLIEMKIKIGKQILLSLPDWHQAYQSYTESFVRALEKKNGR